MTCPHDNDDEDDQYHHDIPLVMAAAAATTTVVDEDGHGPKKIDSVKDNSSCAWWWWHETSSQSPDDEEFSNFSIDRLRSTIATLAVKLKAKDRIDNSIIASNTELLRLAFNSLKRLFLLNEDEKSYYRLKSEQYKEYHIPFFSTAERLNSIDLNHWLSFVNSIIIRNAFFFPLTYISDIIQYKDESHSNSLMRSDTMAFSLQLFEQSLLLLPKATQEAVLLNLRHLKISLKDLQLENYKNALNSTSSVNKSLMKHGIAAIESTLSHNNGYLKTTTEFQRAFHLFYVIFILFFFLRFFKASMVSLLNEFVSSLFLQLSGLSYMNLELCTTASRVLYLLLRVTALFNVLCYFKLLSIYFDSNAVSIILKALNRILLLDSSQKPVCELVLNLLKILRKVSKDKFHGMLAFIKGECWNILKRVYLTTYQYYDVEVKTCCKKMILSASLQIPSEWNLENLEFTKDMKKNIKRSAMDRYIIKIFDLMSKDAEMTVLSIRFHNQYFL